MSTARDGFTSFPLSSFCVFRSIGASGAVNAVVMASIALFPRMQVYLFMILPVPAAIAGVLFVGVDVYGAYTGGSGIANAGHLGGAAVGLVAGLVFRRRLRLRW